MQLKLQQTGEGAGESPASYNWAQSAKGAHCYRKLCRSRGTKMASPPLGSPSDGPLTYQVDIKTLIKSSKGRNGPTLNTITITFTVKYKVGKRLTGFQLLATILRKSNLNSSASLLEN